MKKYLGIIIMAAIFLCTLGISAFAKTDTFYVKGGSNGTGTESDI